MLKSIVVRCAVSMSVLAPATLLGCAAHHDAPAPGATEVKGSVAVALSAYGSDGVKYMLGTDMGLSLDSPSDPSFGSWGISLYGDQATQSYQVPTGSYEASLYGGTTSGGATTFNLLKVAADGSTTAVKGTLIDVNDFKFQVFENQVTALVFHFSVPGLGDLTFSTGTVQFGVSVGVTKGSGTSITETFGATTTPQAGQEGGSNAAVRSVLHVPDLTPTPMTVTATFTGPWAAQLDSICAPATAHVTTTSTLAALQTIAAELDGGSGEVCIGDPQSGSFISISRSGLPVTPALQAVLTTPTTFQGAFYFGTASTVYDDHTFSPERLDPPATATYASANVYLWGSDGSNLYADYFNEGGSSSTVGITP